MTCIIIKNNHNIRILNDKYIRIDKAIDIFFFRTVALIAIFSQYLKKVKIPVCRVTRKNGCSMYKLPIFKLFPVSIFRTKFLHETAILKILSRNYNNHIFCFPDFISFDICLGYLWHLNCSWCISGTRKMGFCRPDRCKD